MKTTARTILSAVIGLGLTAFMFIAALTAGFNGTTTVIAFSLLAIYGLTELALLSYAGPRGRRLSGARRDARVAILHHRRTKQTPPARADFGAAGGLISGKQRRLQPPNANLPSVGLGQVTHL